jgi:hypothetical protein
MSGRKSDQGSKEEIAKGMAETGSGAAPGIKGASDRAKGNPR